MTEDIIDIHIHASAPDRERLTGIAAVAARNGGDPDRVLLAVGRKVSAAGIDSAVLMSLLMALEEIPVSGAHIELYSGQEAVRDFTQDKTFPLPEERMTAERIRRRIQRKELTVNYHLTENETGYLQELADRAYREGAFRIRYSTLQPEG